MKLYTEEQIKDAFIKGVKKGMAGSTLSTYELFEMYISELIPIELPSDEEIENNAYTDRIVDDWEHEQQIGFEIGAKWMKEQILNQNK